MDVKITDTFRRAVGTASVLCSTENAALLEVRHLLEAVINDSTSNAALILTIACPQSPTLVAALRGSLKRPRGSVAPSKAPMSREAKVLIQAAVDIAEQRQERIVGTQHLLLAAFENGTTIANAVSRESGFSCQSISSILSEIILQHTSELPEL